MESPTRGQFAEACRRNDTFGRTFSRTQIMHFHDLAIKFHASKENYVQCAIKKS